MKPETSVDITWLLISFLSLSFEEQVYRIGRKQMINADLIPLTLDQYCLDWLNEFGPCPVAEKFFSLIQKLPYPSDYSYFLTSPDWMGIRNLAPHVLREASLAILPMDAEIDLEDFMEVPKEKFRTKW